VPSQRWATVAEAACLGGAGSSALPTARHEFPEVQSTPLRLVSFAPVTFGVGVTVHAAEAAEGASSNATQPEKQQTDEVTGASMSRLHPTPALKL
jgi:hypothetical protein